MNSLVVWDLRQKMLIPSPVNTIFDVVISLINNLDVLNGPLKDVSCLSKIFSNKYLIIDSIVIMNTFLIFTGRAINNLHLLVLACLVSVICVIYGVNNATTKNQLELTLVSNYCICWMNWKFCRGKDTLSQIIFIVFQDLDTLFLY